MPFTMQCILSRKLVIGPDGMRQHIAQGWSMFGQSNAKSRRS